MSNSEHHGMKPLEGLSPYCTRSQYGHEQRDDRFGRMFGHLAPNYTRPGIIEETGAVGGNMEDPDDKGRTKDVPVGMIFFGQFVDHDITLDASTTFDSVIDNPGEIANVRTPTLDLDCIYGLGPEAQPYLFEQGGVFEGVKLLTGAENPGQSGIAASDVLRAPNGRAIIGDPRNDENRIISQLQLAIIRFHNLVADTIHGETGAEGHDLYEAARRETTWHYQWSVVNTFLHDICGRPIIERILGCGRQFYCSDVPFIPVEFSVAAYRFGHSMIPMALQVQMGGPRFELFGPELGLGFDAITNADAVVDWHELLFTPENRQVERAQKLDTLLAKDLLDLPFVNGSPAEKSLATRNLMRGNAFLLPAGEKVAEDIGVDPKDIAKVIKKANDVNPKFGDEGIPLWLYILAEAEVIGRETRGSAPIKGEGLGPVGATIVAEVIIGLLELDDHSFLGANRNWRPRPEWNNLGKLVTAAQP